MSRRTPRQVICLGVGDGHVSRTRGHAAFLYQGGAGRVLVDCGEPAAGALLRAGAALETLDAIFISHLHFDHVGGLFTLLQGLWLSPRRRSLTIYLPARGRKPILDLMRASRLFAAWEPFALRWEPLRPGQPIAVGEWTVTPVPTTHLTDAPTDGGAPAPVRGEAFGFILESGGRRVAHTADLGGPEDLAGFLTRPLDLLVCELAHVSPPELFARLRGRDIRRVALVHLSESQWRRRRHWLARAGRVLAPIRVCIPRDGQRLTW